MEELPEAALADHAILIHVNNAKLPVAFVELETKVSGDLRGPSTHLRRGVFEAIRQIDSSSDRLLGEGIDDRSASGFDKARCSYSCLTRVHIDADLDGRIQSIQHFGGNAVRI